VDKERLVKKLEQIIERGKHTELMAKQGFYYNLYMSQFKKQEEVKEAVFATKLTLAVWGY